MKLPERRMGSGALLLFATVAIIIDIVQVLLNTVAIGILINRIISFAFACIYYSFLYARDISIIRKKRALTQIGSFFLELIPALDVIPAWTFNVLKTYRSVKKEDEEILKLAIESIEAQKIEEERLIREQQEIYYRNGIDAEIEEYR
jgi:hypothetical protein